jgi:hypothetical protein
MLTPQDVYDVFKKMTSQNKRGWKFWGIDNSLYLFLLKINYTLILH